ncbi:hypothetical protein FHS43_005960 [Streptosporangium becharense]|uniref:Uncharacterized protein n=1 Tax=Streptosporangium becharense TaxID=1816182 RepID=A0A7W9II15_9ACTN|nr:hypothetical protein [Streptosporangium becharense]MBB2914648.1 hypothetical protein [Streptosporangium becharense]MBB5820951.1 hypothetical protein [Streptosporangium becharense]
MTLRTTAHDVLDLFNVTPQTRQALADWRATPAKMYTVVPFVEAHETSFVYQLGPGDVEHVCRTTDHALGEVKRANAERVRAIVDWHPDFAFMHVLHYTVEATRELPTWQRFNEFAHDDPQANSMLWRPAQEEVQRVTSSFGISRTIVRDAMRWRVGNAYYSFLREVYVVTHLRAAGLDVRVHPLADALFRVDFWCGRTACSLLVQNSKFHKDDQGRKRQTSELLSGATPPFQFHKIQLEKASKFGVVHLPSAEQVKIAAQQLRATAL